MANDYSRGEMDIAEQKSTFDSFMSMSVFSGALTGLLILFLSLVFGTGLGWPVSLLISVIAGAILGVVLKQTKTYWVSFVSLVIIAILSGLLVSALGGS